MTRLHEFTDKTLALPAAEHFVRNAGVIGFKCWNYSCDAALTKEAFKEAIELAVNRIAISWTVSK